MFMMLAARLAGLLLLTSHAVARAPSDPTPVSCSIDGLADYSRTMPFCDLAKQARPFGSAQSPYDGNCTIDKDGWPTQDQFGLVFITETTGPGGIMMDGTYTLRFIGNATLSSRLSTWTLLNYTHDPATDVTLAYIQVPKAGNGVLWISFRDAVMKGAVPGGKNISLLQPGCALDDLHALSPSLLKLVGKFDSLRFMDWTTTNGNLEERWSDRRSLDAPSYVAKTPGSNTSGIPWEACVKLANSVEKDMWINIPGHADDDYILNLARLLKATVDPTLFIYFEYANEVWNWQFEVAGYNLHMANASVLVHGDPNHLNYDNASNAGYWAWRRTAYMCKHAADLFKTVFGDGNVGRGKRVRPLLAGQVSFPFVVQTGLEYIEAVFGPPRDFLHGIAGAPYFGIGPGDADPNLTVDDIYAGFDSSIHNMSIAAGFGEDNFMAAHVAMAYHYGLEMRAYEGGPDTSGPNLGKAYLATKGQANIDPRMQGRVATYLANWYSWGEAMGPLNYFVAGATNLIDQYGCYGILQDMRVQDSYKARGVDDVRLKPRPAVPKGKGGIPAVPFTANCTADRVGARKPVQFPYHCDYFGANTTFDFLLQSGPGQLTATVYMRTSLQNATMGVQLGYGPELVVKCPFSGADHPGFTPCHPATFTVPTAGANVLRLRSIGWEKSFRAYSIANVSFTKGG